MAAAILKIYGGQIFFFFPFDSLLDCIQTIIRWVYFFFFGFLFNACDLCFWILMIVSGKEREKKSVTSGGCF